MSLSLIERKVLNEQGGGGKNAILRLGSFARVELTKRGQRKVEISHRG